MLELRPKREPQPFWHDGDIVLGKRAEKLRRTFFGIERDSKAVPHFILSEAITGSPGNSVPIPQTEVMLEVHVVCVAVFFENSRVPKGPVIVGLQFQIR